MIGGCTCAIHGWGRVPSPTCPIHNRHRSAGSKPLLRIVRQPANVSRETEMRHEIEAHEELFLAMLREHRDACALCHDREDLWVTCKLGEVLRGAWLASFRLLVQPATWSIIETVRPFQIGGVS